MKQDPRKQISNNFIKENIPDPPLKSKAVLFALITFFVLTALITLLVYQRYHIIKENQKTYLVHTLNAAKENLQKVLEQSIATTYSLSFLVQEDGTVKDFDSVAPRLLSANNGIDMLEMVPHGVIQYIYPLAGNESVIGYDIMHDSLRKQDAITAIKRNKLYFAGPLELKQGGVAVVGRLPIFIKKKFWGFSCVVIKMPSLLKATGIASAYSSKYRFQLSSINPVTNKEEFFIPDSGLAKGGVSAFINLPNGEWKLSATQVSKNNPYINIILLEIIGVLFAIVGGWFVYVVAKSPARLNELVRQRTIELEDSEGKYRSLIEQASDGVILYRFDGSILQFNKAAFLETGYTKKEFEKLNLKDLLVEKEPDIETAEMDELNTLKKTNFQRKLLRKDGTLSDIELNVTLLQDGNLLAFIRNITNRLEIEKALKQSEEKFSKAFQSTLVAIAIYEEAGRLVDVNNKFAELLEDTRENLLGQNSEATKLVGKFAKDEKPGIINEVKEIVLKKGRLENYEAKIFTNAGEEIFILLSIEPLILHEHKHWLITAVDITDKKNAELLLQQNERKYRALIEQASDGIIISDLSGFIIEVNKSICRMGGYTAKDFIGKHVENFLPKEDVVDNPLNIPDLISGKTLLYERRMLLKNGDVIDVEINSKMSGESTLIGFVRDITLKKKAAEELRKSNERFELIAMATNDAIWDHSFVTNETTGNDNLYELYNLKRGKDKINFETFFEHVHPEERDKMRANFAKAITNKATFIIEEFRFKSQEDTYIHLYDRAFIAYDQADNPVRILGIMQNITQRVIGEKSILREKELADKIINSLPAVFYLYNSSGKFLRWNKNFETVTGYSSEEMKTVHPLDFFEKEEKILLREKIDNVFKNGVDSVEAHFVTKSYEKIPYYFSGLKIDYEEQECLMGFGLDFTETIKAKSILKDSEEKFRSLVEQASEGVTIISTEGEVIYTSPAVMRLTGYEEEQLNGHSYISYIEAGDVQKLQKLFNKALYNPGIPLKSITCRFIQKNGTVRWFEKTFTNMIHIASVNGIVENFRDVTEKVLTEKIVITEKELSDSVINSLPGIFYLCDDTGQLLRWNKNLEAITGYTAEELRKMKPTDFTVSDKQREINAEIDKFFRSGVLNTEFLLTTSAARLIPFFINLISIEYQGSPCTIGIGFDITERKNLEHELLVTNKSLGDKAAELISSYVELERFAYIISHDLQEPLRMISSFLNLLKKKYDSGLDETALKYIHFAVDGSNRMKQLIMDLLEYSRTGSNKEVSPETDMNLVMEEVKSTLKKSIEESEAVFEFDHLPVLLNTSKLQMFQLMQNLIGNALKYRRDVQPWIKVSSTEQEDDWMFSVEDNGIGFDPKFSDMIFVIFQRLHNKSEYSGTGIGLSICKKIVEKHGGKIWVDSVPGKGSTFYFTITKNRSYEPVSDTVNITVRKG